MFPRIILVCLTLSLVSCSTPPSNQPPPVEYVK